jgi:dihydrofolate reductase
MRFVSDIMKVFAFVNLSLDGVMQSPARPEEDPRGGFKLGGWGAPYQAMTEAGEVMANVGGLLVGRWTYEQFHKVWPETKESPFSAWMDNIQKYVASRTLKEPLPWTNSTLLKGDAVDAVEELKKKPGKDLVIMGSGVLIQSLMKRNLIDEYVLLIHPLILGIGRRLFSGGGVPVSLELVKSKTTNKGVIIATYRPKESQT